MMEVSVSQSSPAQFPNHENSDERNADWGELATKDSFVYLPQTLSLELKHRREIGKRKHGLEAQNVSFAFLVVFLPSII